MDNEREAIFVAARKIYISPNIYPYAVASANNGKGKMTATTLSSYINEYIYGVFLFSFELSLSYLCKLFLQDVQHTAQLIISLFVERMGNIIPMYAHFNQHHVKPETEYTSNISVTAKQMM